MTNPDGQDGVRRVAPAHPDIDATMAPSRSASARICAAGGDSCEHPAIVTRPGPTGPRAALVDGPDVWEVIAALHALRDDDPTRRGGILRGELCAVTGLTSAQVTAALDYYTAHPENIDTRIDDNNKAAERLHKPTTGGPLPRDDAR